MIFRSLKNVDIDKHIESILDEYENKISGWKDDLSLKGKNIEVANVQQASYAAYYDEMKVEIKSLYEYYDMRIKEVRSAALQMIDKHSSKAYTTTEKERLIDSDPSFIKYKRIIIEISEIYNTLLSISDLFKDRKFLLNNIVKIRVASLQDITLYEDDDL